MQTLVAPLIAALLLLVAGSAGAAAPVPTRSIVFSPWKAGVLRTDLTVAARERGSCWTESAASDQPVAWRCMAGNEIHDPCFGGGRDPGVVACSSDPFSPNVVLMRLTQPLKKRSPAPASDRHPWALRLANRAVCQFLTGGTGVLDGDRINYGCEPSGWVAGDPDRSHAAWSVKYSAASMPTPASIRRTTVTVAVF